MSFSEESFEALASTTRLEILEALWKKRLRCDDPDQCDRSQQYCNVGELADELGLTQPTVSHHLKELRRAGFITVEKDGRNIALLTTTCSSKFVISFNPFVATEAMRDDTC